MPPTITATLKNRNKDIDRSPPSPFPHTLTTPLLKLCKKNLTRPQQQQKERKKEEEEGEREREMCCCCDGDCRPLGFLLGLPFAFVSLLISIVGVIIWIVGLTLTCICPCCLCVTILVELALELIKAPIHVMEWFTSKIPC